MWTMDVQGEGSEVADCRRAEMGEGARSGLAVTFSEAKPNRELGSLGPQGSGLHLFLHST